MGREVRRVPPGWQHPRDETGHYAPLLDGYVGALARFQKEIDAKGLGEALNYWDGGPVTEDYMLPDVPDEDRTMLMMYETCTEGTPISPAFKTPEELAAWCADTGASAFGSMTASYDGWLEVARGTSVPSAIVQGGCLRSGVGFAGQGASQ